MSPVADAYQKPEDKLNVFIAGFQFILQCSFNSVMCLAINK